MDFSYIIMYLVQNMYLMFIYWINVDVTDIITLYFIWFFFIHSTIPVKTKDAIMRQPFSLNIYCKDTNEKEQAMHHKMNICRE